MFEAGLAWVLAGQGIATAGGPPPPLLSLEIADANPRITTWCGVHRARSGEPGLFRIDRSVQRGEGETGRESLTLVECPQLRLLLDEAVRLSLPSPALTNVTWIAAAAPRTIFRIEGTTRIGGSALGRLEMTSVEGWNAGPTPLAAWARAMERSFQACLDRRGPRPSVAAGEGSEDHD